MLLPRNENDKLLIPPLTRAPGHRLLDDLGRFDEVDREVGVLLDARRDRQDVGVEDDVGRVKANLVDQQPIGPVADLNLALDRLRLSLFVERHHDHTGPVAPNFAGLVEEVLLSLFEGDRVHDRLTLDALETGFDHRPLRAVHHDRDASDLGLGRDEA